MAEPRAVRYTDIASAKKTVIGSEVVNKLNEDLGKIEDLVLDTGAGRIAYAVLSFGGFLGMGDKYFAIPWNAFRFNLAEKHAVPIEVLPFAHATTRVHLERLGVPKLRMAGAAPARSDAGNMLYDLVVPPIDDPSRLDRALRDIPGVVETGLFVGRADVVLVAGPAGIQRIARAER